MEALKRFPIQNDKLEKFQEIMEWLAPLPKERGNGFRTDACNSSSPQ